MSESPNEPYLRTTYAVWELTLRCNLLCIHCGSRARDARPNELTTDEALDLVRQLDEIGIREVSLIGGEAFLRRDWLEIAAEISRRGMRCTMTTGGYGLGPKLATKMAAAGIQLVSVSVDGLEATHDLLRGRRGSWRQAFVAIQSLRDAGIKTGANTQINRLSAPELPLLYRHLRDAGIRSWQTQLTVPMGNAADRPELLLQPPELLDVYPMLAHLLERGLSEGVRMYPGNNIGYFGPYERRFSSRPGTDGWDEVFWSGCQGGILTLGIEADGTIKPDPSLPTAAYAGGNIRDRSLHEIVHHSEILKMNEVAGTEHATDDLWGFCKGCEFAQICRGGDTWTSHVFFDRRGNNPYCHYRSLYHAAAGLRERLRQVTPAPGVPFDNGVFEVKREPCDRPWSADDELRFDAGAIRWPESWLDEAPELPARIADETERSVKAWHRRLPAGGWSPQALESPSRALPTLELQDPAQPRQSGSRRLEQSS